MPSIYSHWGYVAVVMGTFIEGEAVLIAAAALTHGHGLALPWVIVSGCIGSTAWSQLWFQTGRRAGLALLTRRPQLRARVERAQSWQRRHGQACILGCRFLLGMGTALPAFFGLSGFSARRFAVLDVIGAAAWSAAVSGAGWGLGLGFAKLFSAAAGEN
jgi:membrane protein DedA with SNARE-associated domain